MSKFYSLKMFLARKKEDTFILTFDQIEEILGFELPASAYQYSAYWNPSPTHSSANVILECGYKVRPDLYNKTLLFYRVNEATVNVARETRQTTISTSKKYLFDGANVDIEPCVNKFIKVYIDDPNGRYMSYDHIRSAFIKYRKDESKHDYLTLELFAYLASWGMLRNSFLQQKDYLFSRPVIEVLCNDKYDCLLYFNPFAEDSDKYVPLMLDLIDAIKKCYLGHTYIGEGENPVNVIDRVSDTLISKIILGTFGCTVAYDTYVCKGLKNIGFSNILGAKSLYQLISFAKANSSQIKQQLERLNELYTPMKIVDMYFFEKGFELK